MNNKKIALVTGSVGGIGSAICLALAQDGHRVIANYIVPDSEKSWLEAMTGAGFSDAHAAFGDVGDFDAMASMVKKLKSTSAQSTSLSIAPASLAIANFAK